MRATGQLLPFVCLFTLFSCECDHSSTARDGDGDIDGTDDTDIDAADDTDIDAAGDADLPMARLVVVQDWEVPAFRTGAPSIFTDIFLSAEPRFYLISDQQQCEVVLSGNAPSFEASSGTFCALTPGFVLRGWTVHGAEDHIVDSEGRQIVSGSGSRWPLPPAVGTPVGLASDGDALWVADGDNCALHRLELGSTDSRRIACPGGGLRSVSWDGTDLWVLDEHRVHVIDRDGTIRRVLELGVDLSGITVREGRIYGSQRNGETIFRFEIR